MDKFYRLLSLEDQVQKVVDIHSELVHENNLLGQKFQSKEIPRVWWKVLTILLLPRIVLLRVLVLKSTLLLANQLLDHVLNREFSFLGKRGYLNQQVLTHESLFVLVLLD